MKSMRRIVSSSVLPGLAVALLFTGCGLSPDEENDSEAMPTDADVQEAKAALSTQIFSYAAGAQTKKETGIYTWKANKNGKNILFSGWNKNGKRIFRNWVWPTKPSQHGLASLYAGSKEDAIVKATADHGGNLVVGAHMSAAKRKDLSKVLNGLMRDLKNHAVKSRAPDVSTQALENPGACAASATACGVGTALCAVELLGAPPVAVPECFETGTVCIEAALECELVENIQEKAETFLDSIEKAISDAFTTLVGGVCESQGLSPSMCVGT